MLIPVLVLAASFAQQAAPPPPSCRLVPANGRWEGSCGTLFGGKPILTVSVAQAITTGVWRRGLTPIAVWSGEMRFPGGPVPVEIEVYKDRSGILRSGVSWALITSYSNSPEMLRFDLDVSRPVPPSSLDRDIVKRAAEILSSEAVWDRADDRECGANDRAWSIYCAIHRASIEITGGFSHRRPALQVVRQIINERSADRNYTHRLRDYNNDPRTRLEEVHSLFTQALARMNQ